MLIASLCFAVMNIWVKQLTDIPLMQIVFFRSFIVLILLTSVLRFKKISPWGNQKKLLIFRGIFGTAGIAIFFYTLKNMPLASAVVVHYLTPIFTIIIAFFTVKSKVSWTQWVYMSLCLVGITLIKGFDARVSMVSLLIGILGTISAAAAYNVISYLKTTENPLVIMFYFPLITTPIVFIYLWFTGDWVVPRFFDGLRLLGIGLLTYVAQYYLTKAYQMGEIIKVSVVSYLGIVYALIFGFFIFNEWFSWQATAGMSLVAIGVVMTILTKRNKTEIKKMETLEKG
jgi:drug/metabolite transporter (DMT)-like permease